MAKVKVQFKTRVGVDGKTEPAGKVFAMEEKDAMVHVNAGRAVLAEKGEAKKAADDAALAAEKSAKEQADREKAEKEATQKAAQDAAKAKGQ